MVHKFRVFNCKSVGLSTLLLIFAKKLTGMWSKLKTPKTQAFKQKQYFAPKNHEA
jgi:hypothetical protein